MPASAVDGKTEAEAIYNAKTALESQLVTGKIVTIEIDEIETKPKSVPAMKHANPMTDDRTFDDWIKKLS